MKKPVCRGILLLSLLALLLSCKSLSESWRICENDTEKILASLSILNVQVDRTGGWDSVEKEIAALAPLYFWNYGCKIVSAETPDYTAEIQVREREFNLGWRIKRSLAVEVRIWVYEDSFLQNVFLQNVSLQDKLPVAAGRVVEEGENSFSSSKTTSRMLLKAIEEAVKELAEHERLKNDA